MLVIASADTDITTAVAFLVPVCKVRGQEDKMCPVLTINLFCPSFGCAQWAWEQKSPWRSVQSVQLWLDSWLQVGGIGGLWPRDLIKLSLAAATIKSRCWRGGSRVLVQVLGPGSALIYCLSTETPGPGWPGSTSRTNYWSSLIKIVSSKLHRHEVPSYP